MLSGVGHEAAVHTTEVTLGTHTHALHAEAEAASGVVAAWPRRGAGNIVLLRLSEQEVVGCLVVAPTW
jgi:hypothetical protein